MKSILVASLISLAVTLGGYIGVVKFSADRKAKEQAEPTPLTEADLAAADLQLQGLAEQKAAIVGIRASYDVVRHNIDIARGVLVAEQQKLSQLHDRIAIKTTEATEQKEQSLAKVAKLYEQMKPNEAAQIASQLSDDLLVEIIPRMKDRAAGKLLSAMSAKRAAEISRLIAEMKSAKKDAGS